ncbi:MAG: DUF1616 domain-containing protein [Chloroflexota bacterium]
MASSRDLAAAVALALAAAVAALVGIGGPVQAVLGICLVVLLPGYTLVAVLLPPSSAGLPERVVLSVGSSLAIAAVGGVLLHLALLPVDRVTWTGLLVLVTLGLAGVGVLRRSRPPALDREAPRPVEFSLAQTLPMLAGPFGAVLILLSVGAMALRSAANASAQGFTQLWMLPDEANPGVVRLGIRSYEHRSSQFRLQLDAEDEVLAQWPSITLAPGETWETRAVPSADLNPAVPLEATLYRGDRPDVVYRQVTTWPAELVGRSDQQAP